MLNLSFNGLSEEALPLPPIAAARAQDKFDIVLRLYERLTAATRISLVVWPNLSHQFKPRVAHVLRTGQVIEGDASFIPAEVLRSCCNGNETRCRKTAAETDLRTNPDALVASEFIGLIKGLNVWLVIETDKACEREAVTAVLAAAKPSLAAAIEASFTEALPEGVSPWLTAVTATRNPLFFIGQSGRIIFANPAATGTLSQSGPVSITRNGELSVEFSDGLRSGPRIVELMQAEATVIRSLNSPADPMFAFMRPLRFSQTSLSVWERLFHVQLHYTVSFHSESRHEAVAPELIRDAFGLTKTEADLVAALTGGETLGSYAKATGSKESTARWHMKRILQKTHCSSKVELVSRAIHLGYASSL